jgi:hypothetical protein
MLLFYEITSFLIKAAKSQTNFRNWVERESVNAIGTSSAYQQSAKLVIPAIMP